MKISKEKRDKISEHILLTLYSHSPRALFTSKIANEIARNDEFVKELLLKLKKNKLVLEIKKNPKGKKYLRRSRWTLVPRIYELYKRKQSQ